MGTPESISSTEQPSREFQVFIKPVGPACNLACQYCYYIGKAPMVGGGKQSQMTDVLLDRYILQHIEATTGPVIAFSWHGGEPLLAGTEFYRKALRLQQQYCPAGKRIINGLQTNGTLLDDYWSRFLAEAGFLVGISIDGPELLHNRFRKTTGGFGSFQQVMHGFDTLVMHGIDPEILCVVNAENDGYPLEVYHFFRHLGVPFITFIPLVELHNGSVSPRSVNPKAFGDFLCTIFDVWMEQDIGKIKVQIFEEALRTAFHQEHTLCIFKPVCGGVPVVEHNGDFYPCDHFVDAGYHMGNISASPLADLLDSSRQKNFGQAKWITLPEYCIACEVREMCNGECPKNRIIRTPNGEPGLNYLCAGYRKFFNHCRPFAEAVAKVNTDGKGGFISNFP